MPRFSTNISMMFTEYPVLDRFQAASDAGFPAIEIQFPYDIPLDDFAAARTRAGVEIAVFNVAAGDLMTGGAGLAAIPGREAAFREAVALCARYVEATAPGSVNVLAGNPAPDMARDACRRTLVDNLRFAAETLVPLGVRVLLEAVNSRDRPLFFVTTSNQALAIIDEADRCGLGLEHDLYHMQIMEGDLVPTLRRNLDRIGHIQFADTPGRAEPGTGEIDFHGVFAALDEMGYDRWVGAEYNPSRRTEETLGWLKPYL
jgi:hydroxypyruvate isomerase